jgi:hypothetical protein
MSPSDLLQTTWSINPAAPDKKKQTRATANKLRREEDSGMAARMVVWALIAVNSMPYISVRRVNFKVAKMAENFAWTER